MSNILKQLLLQGKNGTQEATVLYGTLVKAGNGETFETHATDAGRHVPTASEDGKALFSKSGAAPEWRQLGEAAALNKADILADAALTGIPTSPTAAAGTNTTQIASTAFVQAAVNSAVTSADAMSYKGKVASESELPADKDVGNGWTYKTTAKGTYKGHKCEVGDMLVARKVSDGAVEWDAYQANIDGAVTGPDASVAENLTMFDGVTGRAVADSSLSRTDVADAVGKKHEHANGEALSKFGVDAGGNALYDGKPIGGCRTVASAAEAAAAKAPAGTMFFVVESAE